MAPLICKQCGNNISELHRINALSNDNFCSLECVNLYVQQTYPENEEVPQHEKIMTPEENHIYYMLLHDGMIDVFVTGDGWCKIMYLPAYEVQRRANNLPAQVEEQIL